MVACGSNNEEHANLGHTKYGLLVYRLCSTICPFHFLSPCIVPKPRLLYVVAAHFRKNSIIMR